MLNVEKWNKSKKTAKRTAQDAIAKFQVINNLTFNENKLDKEVIITDKMIKSRIKDLRIRFKHKRKDIKILFSKAKGRKSKTSKAKEKEYRKQQQRQKNNRHFQEMKNYFNNRNMNRIDDQIKLLLTRMKITIIMKLMMITTIAITTTITIITTIVTTTTIIITITIITITTTITTRTIIMANSLDLDMVEMALLILIMMREIVVEVEVEIEVEIEIEVDNNNNCQEFNKFVYENEINHQFTNTDKTKILTNQLMLDIIDHNQMVV